MSASEVTMSQLGGGPNKDPSKDPSSGANGPSGTSGSSGSKGPAKYNFDHIANGLTSGASGAANARVSAGFAAHAALPANVEQIQEGVQRDVMSMELTEREIQNLADEPDPVIRNVKRKMYAQRAAGRWFSARERTSGKLSKALGKQITNLRVSRRLEKKDDELAAKGLKSTSSSAGSSKRPDKSKKH